MASAIELLKSAEISLHSRFGLWARKVSLVLDTGVSSPDYGMAKLATPQPIIGTANLILDAPGLIRNIPYNVATGTWLLNPGKTYLLRGHGFADTFSAVTSFLKVQWVDESNTPLNSGNIDCPPAFLYPATSTSANSTDPVTEIIYTAPGTALGRSVRLRVTGISGTANIPASGFTAIVMEIPG